MIPEVAPRMSANQAACITPSQEPVIEVLEGLSQLHPWSLLVDAESRIVWTSARLSEIPAAEALRPGTTLREFRAQMDRPERYFPLRSKLRGNSLLGVPLEVPGEGDRRIPLDVDFIRVGEGQEQLMIVVAHERGEESLASLRAALSEAKRQIEALQSANEELEHTIGALAHDLRSPLVGLLGFSRLLRRDYGEVLDETGRHFIDRIEQGARSMERLLQDLLELARIGGPDEAAEWVDAHGLLRQLAAELKPRLDQGGIRLELPEDPLAQVYFNRARLYQLFSNLIGNAIDHMAPGPDACIQVSVGERDGDQEIVVADNGQGVDPAHHGRIFESFQSFGRCAEGSRRTGMGLAIVKRIAEKCGGRVWLDEGGPGARFHVLLPRP